jgi:hypothetical protein
MASQDDVRAIALSLPNVVEDDDHFAFSVTGLAKPRGIAWVWMERIDPKKARVPQPSVLAVRVANEGEKQSLLAAEPHVFFTEPHYNGFPAVLVRLAEIEPDELRELIIEAWRCQASQALVREYDRQSGLQ